MLQPKKRKFKYGLKKVPKGMATRGFSLQGEYGLKAMAHARVTSRQIEACRSAIRRSMKRAGKLLIRIFPHNPISSKPQEVRMGSGKGSVDRYVAMVRPGAILFDIAGVTGETAKQALALAAAKLPMQVKFVEKGVF
ncbi:50S ribosomal protein L16 [Candidatus Cytomitobacter primus]|uniref:50S ribosomal protein L16 n=1 Tax=Candidatus Cytomitobacter primus TaxID=2066024 RepID=A0A5C0UGI7_9PROT|nr:50S ribosomal protein L16 [Candidatus Cytomitobacter primus]QEK38827.1 50S ribosomal protein L16 [Candidatus Cytomitobacter primus]